MSSFKIQPRPATTPLYLKTEASSGGVRVIWIWSEAAIKLICDVYRSTVNNVTTAVKIGDTFGTDFYVDLSAESGTTYFYWVQGRRLDGVLSPMVGPSSVTTGTIALADGGVTPQKLSKDTPVLSGGGSLTSYNQQRLDGSGGTASWSQARAFIGGAGNSSISLGAITANPVFEVTGWDQWTTIAYQNNTGFSVPCKVNIDMGVQVQVGAVSAPSSSSEMGCYARLIYGETGANKPILFSYEWNMYRSIGGVIRHACNMFSWKFNSTGSANSGTAIQFEAGKKYDVAIQLLKNRGDTNLSCGLYNLGCYLDISYVPQTP